MTDRRRERSGQTYSSHQYAYGSIYIATHSIHWGLQYLFHDYNRIDPLVHEAFHQNLPVDWQTLKTLTPHAAPFWQEMAAYKAGTFGFSLPLRDFPNRPALCSFSFQTTKERWPAIQRSREAMALSGARRLHEIILEETQALPRDAETTLTPDETQVLTLLAQGYEEASLCEFFEIPPNRLRGRLKQLAIKLGAKNQTHMIAKAVAAGLIQVH